MIEAVCMPMLPLRGIVPFPYTVLNLEVAREASKKSIERSMQKDRLIFLVSQRDMRVEEPQAGDVFTIGVVARIRHILKNGNGMRVLVEGLSRARIESCICGREFSAAEKFLLSCLMDLTF